MAVTNVLTGLINTIYRNLDVVSREGVGYIPGSSRDQEASRAAKDSIISVPIVPAPTAEDIVPAMQVADGDGQDIGDVQMTVDKARRVKLPWNGNEIRSLNQASGPGHAPIMSNQVIQSMRTLVNEMEVDLGNAARAGSRAVGTAGTTPFASSDDITADARKVLYDNGSPLTDMEMIIDSSAGANLRKLANLTNVDQAGTDDTLRRGVLLPLNGFMIRESAGIASHTAGTGSGYLVNGALVEGNTTITVDTGSGTILAGDVVTFAGDTNQYVVATALSGSTFTIAAPGLQGSIADNAAVTVVASSVQNTFYSRSALYLLNRLPILPEIMGVTRDVAIERETIIDPFTGIPFDLALYLGDNMAQVTVGTAWGTKNIKPEHSGVMLG